MRPDRLSNTAAFIAIKFYGLTRKDTFHTLFDEEVVSFYEQLVQQLPPPLHFYHRGLKNAAVRTLFTFWEELLLPGDLMHIILRKWYLTNWVNNLREQGYQQMLVLGSGFDHLACLNAPKGIQCIALDTPKMMDMKRDFVNRCGYNHPNLHLQNAFFPRNTLQSILKNQANLNPSKKTIVVAEGFFDYFTRDISSTVLDDITGFFSGPTVLLSTLFSLHELSGFRSFVYKKSIRLSGEQLKLHLNRNEYLSLLKSHDFEINKVIDKEQMSEAVLLPNDISYPILPGFYLIKATK